MYSLTFTPRSVYDATLFREIIASSEFHATWDARDGCFWFEEKEDTIDELEAALQELIDQKNINGYFEAE
jgi:hypothetical protein